MPIRAIREYIQLTLSGDDTIDARLELFQRQRESLRAQMAELEHTLSMVEYKCWYYETASRRDHRRSERPGRERDTPAFSGHPPGTEKQALIKYHKNKNRKACLPRPFSGTGETRFFI